MFCCRSRPVPTLIIPEKVLRFWQVPAFASVDVVVEVNVDVVIDGDVSLIVDQLTRLSVSQSFKKLDVYQLVISVSRSCLAAHRGAPQRAKQADRSVSTRIDVDRAKYRRGGRQDLAGGSGPSLCDRTRLGERVWRDCRRSPSDRHWVDRCARERR